MPKEHEDVEATLEQGTTPDTPQQKGKWRAIDWIAGSTLVAEALLSIIWAIVWAFCRFEHQLQVYLALVLIILTGGYLALIFCPIFKKDYDPRWFHARILSSGIVGGSYAFLLPVVMSLPEGNVNSGGAAALRQAILLATGGLIALIALGETRRKNDNDKLKNDQDKEKNDREHLRQVRADRRERYTKAVEQLGDEKAPIRMGGVYTLVGLVDEWLEDESIEKYEDRLKEGQVIINNLCAYIRSPFTLTSHYNELSNPTPTPKGIYKDKKEKFYADKATLDSEADVRLSIIKEIHDRLQGPEENTPGTWSDFEYDFSGSVFFYPVDLTKSYYKKPINFSGSTYEGEAYFSGSTYKGEANFNDSTYQGRANFTNSTYKGWADFTNSTYQGRANFTNSTYQGRANFSSSIYAGWADFTNSTYKGWADFTNSTYKGEANFNDSTYKDWADFTNSTYKGEANFRRSTYQALADFTNSTYQALAYFSGSTYEGEADFTNSTYKSGAYFSGSTYKDWADFSSSIYAGEADFRRSTYGGDADFSRSIFYSETYFGKDKYSNSSSCFTDCAPQFYDETNHKNTLFGSPNNDFTVENGRGYPIYRNLDGLPLGCKFLTSEQKEYLADKFREIEKINNKLCEVKDPEENTKLLDTLESFEKELYEWQEEATTVNVEDVAAEDTES